MVAEVAGIIRAGTPRSPYAALKAALVAAYAEEVRAKVRAAEIRVELEEERLRAGEGDRHLVALERAHLEGLKTGCWDAFNRVLLAVQEQRQRTRDAKRCASAQAAVSCPRGDHCGCREHEEARIRAFEETAP
jgi:hypothetical protein